MRTDGMHAAGCVHACAIQAGSVSQARSGPVGRPQALPPFHCCCCLAKRPAAGSASPPTAPNRHIKNARGVPAQRARRAPMPTLRALLQLERLDVRQPIATPAVRMPAPAAAQSPWPPLAHARARAPRACTQASGAAPTMSMPLQGPACLTPPPPHTHPDGIKRLWHLSRLRSNARHACLASAPAHSQKKHKEENLPACPACPAARCRCCAAVQHTGKSTGPGPHRISSGLSCHPYLVLCSSYSACGSVQGAGGGGAYR